MITVTLLTVNKYAVKLDSADRKAIRRLAKAYSISFDSMLVACINKGIDNIGEVVTRKADPRIPDSDEQ